MDTILKMNETLKIECARREHIVSAYALASPCLERPPGWFDSHGDTLMEDAMHIYAKDKGIPPNAESLKHLPRSAQAILFERVVATYVHMAASKELTFPVKQGCCNNFKICQFVLFQKAVLMAIRKRVKGEEEEKAARQDTV